MQNDLNDCRFQQVSNEFLLKETKGSIFYQNLQLYFWGVLICFAQTLYSTKHDESPDPAALHAGILMQYCKRLGSIFTGFSALAWLIAGMQAVDGEIDLRTIDDACTILW